MNRPLAPLSSQTASAAGTQGLPGFAAYAAAKEANRALTRVAANEWGRDGITVNVVCPMANSPGWQQWAERFGEMRDAHLRGHDEGKDQGVDEFTH